MATSCADQLPPFNKRVLIWSQKKWKPGTWKTLPGAGLKPGAYLDCGTGPVEFTHWCELPPAPHSEDSRRNTIGDHLGDDLRPTGHKGK